MCENSNLKNYVSVVVPIKNEEKYIKNFIVALEKQTYSKEEFEVIFADGRSTDNTLKIIDECKKSSSLNIMCYTNEKENAPSGVNLGIRKANGNIIIRMDAHTVYDSRYIEKNVYYLINGYGDNVGCPIDTVGEGFVGKSISYVLSTKFGVGNSKFRTTRENGLVDTVPFGCFYKELINKIGYFDESLPRSEDNDFNYRVREYGGKVYQFNDITSVYYARTSVKDLVKMAYGNGVGIASLLKKDRNAVSIRHLIPFLFFTGNLVGILFSVLGFSIIRKLYGFVLAVYFVCALGFSVAGIAKLAILNVLLCVVLYPILHMCYGFGTFKELLAKDT